MQKAAKELGPSLIVHAGDITDLPSLSRHLPGGDDNQNAIRELKVAVSMLNKLNAHCGGMRLLAGNHDERFDKALQGMNAPKFKGAKGLTFKDQMYAQGLDPKIRFAEESLESQGLWLGKRAVLVRHGHKVGIGRQNMAQALLRKNPGVSTIVGHHHRAELAFKTSFEETTFGMTLPHMSKRHSYDPWPNWQMGFAILTFRGAARMRDCTRVDPTLCLMDEHGRFSFGGKVYGP